jgi:hypothetical protein
MSVDICENMEIITDITEKDGNTIVFVTDPNTREARTGMDFLGVKFVTEVTGKSAGLITEINQNIAFCVVVTVLDRGEL